MHLTTIYYLIIALIWAIVPIITKVLIDQDLDVIDLFTFSAIFYISIAIIINLIHKGKFKILIKKLLNKSKQVWFTLILYNLLNIIAFLLFIKTIKYNYNIFYIIAIIIATPIITALASFYYFKVLKN